jgi:OmcA/MtrC family decaheme c-type cytochrome
MAVLACTVLVAGCGGSDGSDGTSATIDDVVDSPDFDQAVADAVAAATADQAAARITGEACSTCHDDAAAIHTVEENVLTVTASSATLDNGAGTVTINFTVEENGAPYTAGFVSSAEGADYAYAYAAYLDANGEWINYLGDPANKPRSSVRLYRYSTDNTAAIQGRGGDYVNNGDGTYSFTFPITDSDLGDTIKDNLTYADVTAVATGDQVNRFVFYARVYRDTNGDGLNNNSDVRSSIEAVVDVVPNGGPAAVTKDLTSKAACVQCHNERGYIAHGGRLDPDFCVVCHNENSLGDDTWDMDNMVHGLHNSHYAGAYDPTGENIEFGYPQAMTNCATCHDSALKLTTILDDANFTYDTCMTCHTGMDDAAWDFSDASFHSAYTTATNCQGCHSAGAGYVGPSFTSLHNGGYDPKKYTDTGLTKYTYDALAVTSDGTDVTVVWGAKDSAAAQVDVSNEDAAAGPVFYGLPADRNNASEGVRLLVGYFADGTNDVVSYDNFNTTALQAAGVTTYAGGIATSVLPLSAEKIAAANATKGIVALIGIPQEDGKNVAVVSVVAEFMIDGTAVTTPRTDIADVASCDNCHDSILIHEAGAYGHTAVAEVKACMICHAPSSAAGHYAQQSRSLDAYIHAIHAEQPTFSSYGSHVIEYPTNIEKCSVCHGANAFEVPDQSLSTPAVTSGFEGDDGKAIAAQAAVVGPAAMACGSCHKALASTDGEVTSLNTHFENMGYRELTSTISFQAVLETVFNFTTEE